MRFVNRSGRIDNSYPTNIYVDKVISREGARGLFCVSESGGIEINSIQLTNNGNNSILIENYYNLTIHSGEVIGGNDIRIASRADEFEKTRDITIANLRVINANILEKSCADNMNWINLDISGDSKKICG